MVQAFTAQNFDLQPERWTGAGGSRTIAVFSRGCQMTDCGQLWVWRDPALAQSLGWYAAVAANRKPAKFRIAATIPVSLALEEAPEQALWEELDRLRPVFLSRWSEVRDARAGLAPRTPSASLLDLCRELAWRMLGHCNFCRWDCRVDRREGTKLGACKLGSATRVSSHFHHPGEELVYRGLDGVGTIFFTSCNMRCAFCQNGDISTDKDNGEPTDERTLATMAWLLRMEGCHNVNWVGGDPTIHLHTIVAAMALLGQGFTPSPMDLSRAFATKSDRLHWFDRKPEQATYAGAFNVPMLWNSNFFMTPETMKVLRLLIDVWLPDFKFGPGRCAMSLAKTPWYWETVTGNLAHIHDCGEDFTIRHLVLPNHVECCTYPVLDWLAEHMPEAPINIMDQYHPDNFCDPRAAKYRPQYAELSGRPPSRNRAALIAGASLAVAVRDRHFREVRDRVHPCHIDSVTSRHACLQMPARANQPLPASPFTAVHERKKARVVRALASGEVEKILAEHRRYLETGRKEGVRARFSSADLRGMSFTGMNLRRARFDHAQLAGADFTHADLSGANLIGADLQSASMAGADMTEARLSGANLACGDLEGACLQGAAIEFALLPKVVLVRACLRDADMSGVVLAEANLSEADVQRANLRGADLHSARLDGTDLREARLGGAFLGKASLRGADLRGGYLRLARLDGTDLSGADLRGVEGLTLKQLDAAVRDHETKLPEGCQNRARDGG